MFEINYSIIIPHKNSPELLQRCLDSIPAREDTQVIVVDDNSDDDKIDLKKFPQWKGEHYEYHLTKEGKGAGYARNVGLKYAKGKWVLFIDADDFLSDKCNLVFDNHINTEADIIFFYPKSVMSKDIRIPSNRAKFYHEILEECQKKGKFDRLIIMSHAPWSKFIKLSLIKENNIWFDEIKYGNDNFFSIACASVAKEIKINKISYYIATEGDSSLTKNYMQKPGEIEIRANAFLHSYKFALKYGYDCIEAHTHAKWLLNLTYGVNWKLYSQYFKLLNNRGYSVIELLREQFKTRNRITRWSKYITTMTHVIIQR